MSGIAGSYVNAMFNFLRNPQTILHRDCTSSHTHQQHMPCVHLCPTLCDPIDCSPLDSSVHGIFQARILEWVTISSSKGSS